MWGQLTLPTQQVACVCVCAALRMRARVCGACARELLIISLMTHRDKLGHLGGILQVV